MPNISILRSSKDLKFMRSQPSKSHHTTSQHHQPVYQPVYISFYLRDVFTRHSTGSDVDARIRSVRCCSSHSKSSQLFLLVYLRKYNDEPTQDGGCSRNMRNVLQILPILSCAESSRIQVYCLVSLDY